MDANDLFRMAEARIQGWPQDDHTLLLLRWTLELDPGHYEAAKYLAQELMRQGEHDEARTILARLVPPEGDEDGLVTHALAQTGCFDFPGARATLSRGLEIEPFSGLLLGHRGLVSFLEGDHESAALDLVRMAVVGPTDCRLDDLVRDHEPFHGRGDFRALSLSALSALEKQVEGDRAPLRILAILVHLAKKEIARARRAIARLEKKGPRSWVVPALEAVAIRLGERERDRKRALKRELERLRLARDEAPDELTIAKRFIDLTSPADQEELGLYEAILEQRPRWIPGYTGAAYTCAQLKRWDDALDWANRALGVDGESSSALECRASVYSWRHEHREELADRERLVTLAGADDAPEEDEDPGLVIHLNHLLLDRAWARLLRARSRRSAARLRPRRRQGREGARGPPEALPRDSARVAHARFFALTGDRRAALADLDFALANGHCLPEGIRASRPASREARRPRGGERRPRLACGERRREEVGPEGGEEALLEAATEAVSPVAFRDSRLPNHRRRSAPARSQQPPGAPCARRDSLARSPQALGLEPRIDRPRDPHVDASRARPRDRALEPGVDRRQATGSTPSRRRGRSLARSRASRRRPERTR